MKRLLFVVLLLAGASVTAASPARAEVCSGTSGVTVIVQFPDGHIESGCAPGDPATGIQALTRAGFRPTPVPGQQGATVCQINDQPAAGEQCWQPPNYWAYFYAQRGGSWTYSDYGAGNRDPKPGTVEGWKFGGSRANPPSTAPPSKPASPTTPHPTGAPRPTAGASNPVVKPASSGRPSSSATPSAAGASASRAATPTATSTDAATSAATAKETDQPAASQDAADASGALNASSGTVDDPSGDRSWVWGLGLVAVLAGTAAATAIRRRKA